jgi:5-methyltetrahydrofolate--homocysteine methyltransferase
MNHVAKEMQRLSFSIPLLIGGATTSRAHTAIKIEPFYHNGATVHVLDASRAVGVASQLLSDTTKDVFIKNTREEYDLLRHRHKNKKSANEFISLEAARVNKIKIDWQHYTPPRPHFLGTKTFTHYPLTELIPFIDWTPFFHTWELAGRYPAILEDEIIGESATQLFKDAQAMLHQICKSQWISANAVIGFFPANSVGDDIEIYTDDTRKQVRATFRMLRQQTLKSNGKPNLCLSDFIAPKSSGLHDYMGCFAVTAGIGLDTLTHQFELKNDEYNSILLKALADRFAEAFAEHIHYRVRKEFWSYAVDETLSNEEIIAEKYQGIRPAPGYPACPDHTEKPLLFELLNAPENTGIILTENFAMLPASSVSGYYFSHPDSHYFGLGKIEEDQVADYAYRKNMALEIIKRWLAPNLSDSS